MSSRALANVDLNEQPTTILPLIGADLESGNRLTRSQRKAYEEGTYLGSLATGQVVDKRKKLRSDYEYTEAIILSTRRLARFSPSSEDGRSSGNSGPVPTVS